MHGIRHCGNKPVGFDGYAYVAAFYRQNQIVKPAPFGILNVALQVFRHCRGNVAVTCVQEGIIDGPGVNAQTHNRPVSLGAVYYRIQLAKRSIAGVDSHLVRARFDNFHCQTGVEMNIGDKRRVYSIANFPKCGNAFCVRHGNADDIAARVR